MSDLAEGLREEQDYRDHGANDDQINEWKTSQIAEFRKANASDKQINDYFGVKETDTAAMKAYVQKNLNAFHESRKAADGTVQKEAASFGEAFDAGWENSVTGLTKAGHMPDTVLPEHAGFFTRLASNIGQMTGDLPAMASGGFAGMMAGAPVGGAIGTSVLPGVGTLGGIAAGSVIGGGAGAFAAPAAMRKLLMDHYEKGDVKDAGDFTARLASTTWEAVKGGAVGALTAGTGMLMKPVAGAAGALTSELVMMTTAGAAMEGRLPQPQEFLDGAVVLGGFHLATGGVPTKLRNIFAATGERPAEVVAAAQADPVLKQELLSNDPKMPEQAAPVDNTIKPEEDELDKALAGEGKGGGEKPPSEPPEPPKPPEPEDVQRAREAINKTLAVKKESGQSWGEWFKQKKDSTYAALVDLLDPVAEDVKAAGGTLEASKDPYKLLRNLSGWKGKANSFLSVARNFMGQKVGDGGTIDFKTGETNGESLESALSNVKPEEQKDFVNFAMAKRSLERTESGFNTKIKPEDAKTIIAADEARFGESFKRLVDYSDRVMTYARDAGLISKESFNKIKKGSGNYIPLMIEEDFDEFTGKSKGQDGGLFQPFEGYKGNRGYLNPIEQIMRNTMRVVKAADLNNAVSKFGDMIDQNGFGIGEKIEEPTAKDLRTDNVITFKRDGELQAYKIKSDTAEAIKSMNSDPGKTALWARMLMAPAGWLRAGTVLNPDFIVRHGERSFFTSAIQSTSGLGSVFSAPIDLARAVYGNFAAIGDIMRNSEVYQAFLRSGGAQSSIFGIEDYLGKQNIWDLNREAGNFMEKSWNLVKSPLEAMAHVSDNMARVAEFKRAGGLTGDLNAKIEAGFRAREVTIDYMRAGAQIKAVSSFVPFMNIGIQGMDRMAQSFKADKLGFTARAAAALTVPTLLNWAASRNDSRYQDAPNWEKDLYWIVPLTKWEKSAGLADAMSRPQDLRRQADDGSWEVNNGITLRISKPFELGILFASVPERLLNRFFDHDPRAGHELLNTILHGALPNVLPTALTPILEQATNKNFFTDRPVISSHVEGMLPEYQYNEYTSTVAKQLGHLVGFVPGLRDLGPKDAKLASPQVIDNYIHDWTGTLGQYALQIISKTEQGMGIINKPPPPASTMAEWPVIKAFIVRHPSAQLQPIQDFYDDYDKAAHVNATIASLLKKGDATSIKDAMDLQKNNQGDMLQLTPIKQSLGTIAKTLQGINDMPAILPNGAKGPSPTEKRQLMDAAYYQMSMIAKTGNQIIDARRKQLNAQTGGTP